MRIVLLFAGAAAVSLSLAGCNKPAGSQICTPFATAAATPAAAPGAPTPSTTGDPAAALDDCLHRWGYTLAASSDRAQEVAQAVVAACSPALTRWNQQILAQAASSSTGGGQVPNVGEAAPSLLTGQSTTPISEHYNYAQGRALFYVVQGRAGKCAPPPASGQH